MTVRYYGEMISICIFEDAEINTLEPITHTHAIYDTMLGTSTLFEKIDNYFTDANISLHCRDYLKSITKLKYPDTMINNINIGTPCLFINGRLYITETIYKELNEIDVTLDISQFESMYYVLINYDGEGKWRLEL